ncbi:MAG TPA: NAD-dependent epimerase [Stellaceae bacterium]|jgi:UDP-glucuronate 4-epimerase|nr:NAD-dependent epimerase [Stellaceae bacterium]
MASVSPLDAFPDRPVLVTGAAGFIGYHLAARLLGEDRAVIGLDNLNPYYDVALKNARLARLQANNRFTFAPLDLAQGPELRALVETARPAILVNLAAQAGVRYSLTNPHAYAEANLTGFLNVLEACRHAEVKHLVYASTSSVYGANTKMPFSTDDPVDHPLTLYAATKRANELMAHSYSHLFNIPMTGLRFFTVYGPWGRPDMALFLFTKAILAGEPINVFAGGELERDFTYVDDVVEGVRRVMDRVPAAQPGWDADNATPGDSSAPFRVYNIGGGRPVKVSRFIEVLEGALGRKAKQLILPMQPGDVVATRADTDALRRDTGFVPTTPIEDGVRRFVDWYREFYRI